MARPGVDAAVTSCELQAERCRAFIEQRSAAGWHFVQRFDDEGESGATLGRDGLIDLMLVAENGDIDQVVVHRVDRLSRNLGAFVHLLDFFTELNVGISFVVPRRTVQWVRRDDRAGWLMGRQVAAARAPITELVSGTSRCVKYAAA